MKPNRMSQWPLHLMILPALLFIVVYSYGPMAGIIIAFQKFIPARGVFDSAWVGWDNFRYVLDMPDSIRVLRNTIFISLMKIVANLIVPITIALLLNEVRKELFKRSFQTLIYLPHFLSWILLGNANWN
jgi:putative aldouronate transport system permease protein